MRRGRRQNWSGESESDRERRQPAYPGRSTLTQQLTEREAVLRPPRERSHSSSTPDQRTRVPPFDLSLFDTYALHEEDAPRTAEREPSADEERPRNTRQAKRRRIRNRGRGRRRTGSGNRAAARQETVGQELPVTALREGEEAYADAEVPSASGEMEEEKLEAEGEEVQAQPDEHDELDLTDVTNQRTTGKRHRIKRGSRARKRKRSRRRPAAQAEQVEHERHVTTQGEDEESHVEVEEPRVFGELDGEQEHEDDDEREQLDASASEPKAKARALDAKYAITESNAWQSQKTLENRRGIVGEYLALENAASLMEAVDPLEREPLLYWHNVEFRGTCYNHATGNDALSENYVLGETDLMQVRQTEGRFQCVGVGNVKVGHSSSLVGDATKQNDDAIGLLDSFIGGTRYKIQTKGRKKKTKWALVKTVTYSIDGKPHTLDSHALIKTADIQKLTIGASGAPGAYGGRLDYTVDQIIEIAKHLQDLGGN